MSLETVTVDDALRLLTQPRTVGEHPEDGKPITAQNGRYGPYVKWGKESRSLEDEDQIFTVDLEAAIALLAQPKKGRSRTAAAPLKELGEDPNTEKPVVLRNGRFGPYVTDGETNASLRVADSVDTITLDRAVELLAERRAKGPAPKRKPKKVLASDLSPPTLRNCPGDAEYEERDRVNRPYIAFEGIEGAGKSTVAQLVGERLEADGLPRCPCARTGRDHRWRVDPADSPQPRTSAETVDRGSPVRCRPGPACGRGGRPGTR